MTQGMSFAFPVVGLSDISSFFVAPVVRSALGATIAQA